MVKFEEDQKKLFGELREIVVQQDGCRSDEAAHIWVDGSGNGESCLALQSGHNVQWHWWSPGEQSGKWFVEAFSMETDRYLGYFETDLSEDASLEKVASRILLFAIDNPVHFLKGGDK